MTHGAASAGTPASLDPAFVSLATAWTRDQADILLRLVWQAYDAMQADMPFIDTHDLERSITQLLEPRINAAMTGDEPFYVQHGSFERETMAKPPAQPPAYDLAFVLRAEERIMWPLEAKVLETPSRLADYERDVRDQFLACRYAPFSNEGGMVGYLLTGSAAEALAAIEVRLNCVLQPLAGFGTRPHRASQHQRTVPAGKPYPADFRCHHLIMEFLGLSRHSTPP